MESTHATKPSAPAEENPLDGLSVPAETAKAREIPRRERLPATRSSLTHRFSISGTTGYITVGLYPDGRPGEVFLTVAKEGSTLGGLMDTIGVLSSLALQHGVPVEALARKFQHTRFEPSGHTTNPDIRVASSISDYVFTWLGVTFSPEFRAEYEASQARREADV
jgi:ribonucleoside-diphosphate reductase alpha chain